MVDVTQKPVAWINKSSLEQVLAKFGRYYLAPNPSYEDDTPLYTHPTIASDQEPSAWMFVNEDQETTITQRWDVAKHFPEAQPLYTRADSPEVEKLRADRSACWAEFKALVKTAGETEKYLNQRLDDAQALLSGMADCPWVVEEATIPKAGIDAAPNQVVGTMHVSLARLRNIRAFLSGTSQPTTFSRGDTVRKKSGSEWEGKIVGVYSTSLTPEGYAVESSSHAGSVQIYPAAAIELVAKAAEVKS